MKHLTLLVALLTIGWIAGFSQSAVTVSGRVTETGTGNPVANHTVHVELDSNINGYYATVLTNANGYYYDTISIPPFFTQGVGWTHTQDCNQQWLTNSFSFAPAAMNITGLDFQICTGGGQGTCQAAFTSTPIGGTTGYSFTDLSTGSSAVTSWYWDFGDGNSSTQQNPTHTYNAQGLYLVCLTIQTSQGCTSTFCDSVQVGGGGGGTNCSVSIFGNPSGQVGTFSASASGTGSPVSYIWDFGNGNTQTTAGNTVTYTYPNPGNYLVCVTVIMSDSCSATDCDSVAIGGGGGSNCTASFGSQANGLTVSFSDNSSGTAAAVSWSWSFGDGSGSSQQNPTHTYSSGGAYNVCLTVVFADSCSDTYCSTVQLNGGVLPCQANYYWFPDTSGQYSIIVVNTSTGSNLSYYWDFGDGNTSTQGFPQHQYAGPGLYNVCLTVADSANACTSTFCDSILVLNKVNAPFTINVVSTATSTPQPEPEALSIDIYPNPVEDVLHIAVELDKGYTVQMQLMDLQGRTVKNVDPGMMSTGAHTLDLQVNDLPAGMYLLRSVVGETVSVQRIVVGK